jgi:hypothetical protein
MNYVHPYIVPPCLESLEVELCPALLLQPYKNKNLTSLYRNNLNLDNGIISS